MASCLIGLGSNLGDRAGAIKVALERLNGDDRTRVVTHSRLYRTRPVGGPPDQKSFLNAAAVLETSLEPGELMRWFKRIEQQLGREPSARWDSRVIDLDLLLYDQLILDTPSLVLPHPRMAFRRFVLSPAVEVAADMVHPSTGWKLERLLRHLISADDYVAITGPIGAGKTKLVEQIRSRQPSHLITPSLDETRLARLYDDPTGCARETELEFLHLRARKLAEALVGQPHWVLSDFWLGQSLAYARMWLPSHLMAEFEEAWQAACAGVPQPKLLVLLDAPVSDTIARGPAEARFSADWFERLRGELIHQATLPDQGPLLRLEATDFSWAITELHAAIQAMSEPTGQE